jgi:hypothetical protein
MYVELSSEIIKLAKHLRGYESGSMVWLLANAVVEASERAEHDDDRGAFVDDDYIDPPQSLVDNLATRAHHSTAVRYTRGPESAYSFLRKRDAE